MIIALRVFDRMREVVVDIAMIEFDSAIILEKLQKRLCKRGVGRMSLGLRYHISLRWLELPWNM